VDLRRVITSELHRRRPARLRSEISPGLMLGLEVFDPPRCPQRFEVRLGERIVHSTAWSCRSERCPISPRWRFDCAGHVGIFAHENVGAVASGSWRREAVDRLADGRKLHSFNAVDFTDNGASVLIEARSWHRGLVFSLTHLSGDLQSRAHLRQLARHALLRFTVAHSERSHELSPMNHSGVEV
jgi:hypothetical protein